MTDMEHDPETILRRIADADPSGYRYGDSVCIFCDIPCDDGDTPDRHQQTCPWRQANEHVRGH